MRENIPSFLKTRYECISAFAQYYGGQVRGEHRGYFVGSILRAPHGVEVVQESHPRALMVVIRFSPGARVWRISFASLREARRRKMKVLPEIISDEAIVEDFRAYVEWVRDNPPSAPAPYPTVGVCAQVYCYVHLNDHGDQVHAAVWVDVESRGDRDKIVRV